MWSKNLTTATIISFALLVNLSFIFVFQLVVAHGMTMPGKSEARTKYVEKPIRKLHWAHEPHLSKRVDLIWQGASRMNLSRSKALRKKIRKQQESTGAARCTITSDDLSTKTMIVLERYKNKETNYKGRELVSQTILWPKGSKRGARVQTFDDHTTYQRASFAWAPECLKNW